MQKTAWKKAAAISALAAMLMLTACSGNKSNNGASETASSSAASGNTSTESASASASESPAQDPLGKYDPPIEVSTVKGLDDASMQFLDGESIDDNVWTKALKEDLGINLKVQWLVPSAQYESKLNVTIASNDLPDIMLVNAVQLNQLVENGMVEDLTQVYNDYKSDLADQYLTADGGTALKQATYDGKMMAIPQVGSSADTSPILWIRQDWLDQAGLQSPKTMDDVINVAKAFTENDPDQNGKKDTYGLGLEKNLFGGEFDLNGFFNGYHALTGNLWMKDSSGKLISSVVAPEAKTVLAQLAAMYKAGYLSQEFSVKDGGKVSEDVTSEKVGMFYGQHWAAFYPLPDAKTKNPKADWRAYPIPSVDETLTVENQSGTGNFFVAKKGIAHPEAAIKLLNFYLAKGEKPSPDYEDQFHFGPLYPALFAENPSVSADKIANEYQYAPIFINHPQQNLLIYQGYAAYSKSRNPDDLSAWAAKDEGSLKTYNDNFDGNVPASEWPNWAWSMAPYSGYSVINDYVQKNQTVAPLFYGVPTPTMTAKQSTLDKLVLEEYTKIIMGAVPVDDFDKFVNNWNSLGGADITKEVNDWAAAQK